NHPAVRERERLAEQLAAVAPRAVHEDHTRPATRPARVDEEALHSRERDRARREVLGAAARRDREGGQNRRRQSTHPRQRRGSVHQKKASFTSRATTISVTASMRSATKPMPRPPSASFTGGL